MFGRQAARWQMAEVLAPDRTLLKDLASINRESFAAGDMFPGLPPADGITDTAASILRDLDDGIRLWMVRARAGRPLGCVRAVPLDDGGWHMRRLAVAVAAQGHGLGRRLVRGLEQAARDEGVPRLVAWALVERGIPPFYSRLGYRTTGRFGSPDKLLTEAIMELELGHPCPPLDYPWGTESCVPGHGTLVTWFASERCTVAVVDRLAPEVGPIVGRRQEEVARAAGRLRLVGADGWAGSGEAAMIALRDELASRADAQAGPGLVFRRPCQEVRDFTMPRAVRPELLALWRLPVARHLGGEGRPQGNR